MKRLFTLSFIFLFRFIQPSFLNSFEDELDQAAHYWLCRDPWNIETLEDAKNVVLNDPMLSKKNYDDYIFSMDDTIRLFIQDGQASVAVLCSELKKVFEVLKLKMGIAIEVDLKFCIEQSLCPEALMSYTPLDRTVYIYPLTGSISPSEILFTLIHELTHAKQHMKKGIMQFIATSQYEKEHEADITAATMIKCPLCMEAVTGYHCLIKMLSPLEYDSILLKEGYLVSEDFKKYLLQKSLDDICETHKNVKYSNIESKFDNQQSLERIYHQDRDLSSIEGRLSTLGY